MLAQRVERIRDGLIETGKREGKREGKRLEAERLFLKLYTVKNGGRAPAGVRRRASEAKLKQLETWAARLIIVGRAEDVFDD